MPKPIGKINGIDFNITKPMEMHTNIDMNKSFSVFIGPNGSGKTFVLVNTYALGSIASGIATGKLPKAHECSVAEFIYNACFDDMDIDGVVSGVWDDFTLTITFDKGKVVSLTHNIVDMLPVPVVFLSSGMRLFTSVVHYMRMRNLAIPISEKNKPDVIVSTMLTHFKMYDVTFVEAMIQRCPVTISAKMKDTLKEHYSFTEDVVTFDVDLDKPDFFMVMEDGSKKYMCSYSAGQQSIINMFIGSNIGNGT